MRRLNDQILVLRAIGNVRNELKTEESQGATNAQIYATLSRLVTLYAMLNVDQLEQVVADADNRDHRKAA